ncbi:unnamed protein product, partial [Ectocarpus sp. 8 AP-2014]
CAVLCSSGGTGRCFSRAAGAWAVDWEASTSGRLSFLTFYGPWKGLLYSAFQGRESQLPVCSARVRVVPPPRPLPAEPPFPLAPQNPPPQRRLRLPPGASVSDRHRPRHRLPP